MGGNQTSLCTTNEKHDHGNASAGVLRQWRPSSSTTHRSSPSFSLPLNSSLIAHSSSPFLLLRPATCVASSSLHGAVSTFQLPRTRFFPSPRILIFFINFSRALQTILSPFLPPLLRLVTSSRSDSQSYPPYSAFPNPCSSCPPRVSAPTAVFLTNGRRIWPFRATWGCWRASLSLRANVARSLVRRGAVSVFRVSHHRLFFPPQIFCR